MDKDQVKENWEALSEYPEFEVCLNDLLRYVKFFKPLTSREYTTEEHVGASFQRAVITYILDKTDYTQIEVQKK